MFVRPSRSSPTLQEYQLFQSAPRSSGHLTQASGHQNPVYPEINCVNQSPQSHEGLAGVRGQPGCDLSTSAPPLCLPFALTLPGSPCFRATVCPRAWALRASAQASEVIPGWDFFFCFVLHLYQQLPITNSAGSVSKVTRTPLPPLPSWLSHSIPHCTGLQADPQAKPRMAGLGSALNPARVPTSQGQSPGSLSGPLGSELP